MSSDSTISGSDLSRAAEVMEAARYSGLVDEIKYCSEGVCISLGSLCVCVPVEQAETVLERALVLRMEGRR